MYDNIFIGDYMKNKIINSMLAVVLVGLFVMTYSTFDINETIDAFSGATPSNAVIDAMVGATDDNGEHEDEDDEEDEPEWDDD